VVGSNIIVAVLTTAYQDVIKRWYQLHGGWIVTTLPERRYAGVPPPRKRIARRINAHWTQPEARRGRNQLIEQP